MKKKPVVKGSTLLLVLLLHIAAKLAPAATVNCAGADLSKVQRAVYVSPEGNDSISCGHGTGSPCRTIQQGIANCKGEGCGVLVRHGIYNLPAALELADGVSLYGSCVFEGVDQKYRSTVLGRPAIRANNINKPTTLHGFVIMGTNAAAPGEASIAMVVSNSKGLTLGHDVVASGKGGDGRNGAYADGATGANGSGAVGKTGGGGGRACPSNPPPASDGGGGRGADFNNVYTWGRAVLAKCKTNNLSESVGKVGEKSGAVPGGGGGERGGAGCMCDPNGGSSGDGPTGGNGNPGQCSSAGGKPTPNNKGAFSGTTWIASHGDSGGLGQVGSGGGGGGSGGYAVYVPTWAWEPLKDFDGRPGGGGGGGGCGGPSGQGGQQGGASIPLVLFNSSVIGLASTNVLIPGPGGRGGNGALGGKGGPGGQGAQGQKAGKEHFHAVWACEGWGPGDGGKGGNGGQGGAGSGGAGGNGGPSFAIAVVNSQPLSAQGLAIYPAQPGAGGGRGAGGQNEPSQCKGADGELGLTGFSDNSNSIVSFTSPGPSVGGDQ
jgi:hypothetical protein